MMRVTEIFRSIQGESTHAGRPCTFVRLTGCPMRCVWCDSEYTFTGGEYFSLDDVLNQVRELKCKLVEITGGEPLAQREAFLLHHEGGLDIAQIAAATGSATEAAKSRLRYAMNKLREAIGDD